MQKKVFKDKAHNLPNNERVKSNKSEILVLDEMIEQNNNKINDYKL